MSRRGEESHPAVSRRNKKRIGTVRGQGKKLPTYPMFTPSCALGNKQQTRKGGGKATSRSSLVSGGRDRKARGEPGKKRKDSAENSADGDLCMTRESVKGPGVISWTLKFVHYRKYIGKGGKQFSHWSVKAGEGTRRSEGLLGE